MGAGRGDRPLGLLAVADRRLVQAAALQRLAAGALAIRSQGRELGCLGRQYLADVLVRPRVQRLRADRAGVLVRAEFLAALDPAAETVDTRREVLEPFPRGLSRRVRCLGGPG